MRIVDALLPAAHRGGPAYLDPARRVDRRRPPRPRGRRARGRRGRRRLPPGGDGRARRRPRATSPTTSATTTSAPRSCCARWPGAASPAGSCSPRAWSSTARAATRAREHGVVRPAPRARRRPRRRALRAALPALRRARSSRARSPRTRPATRATSTPRRSSPRSTCAPRSRARPASPVDRAALPQRLRAADAARHALRRRREHLPLRARRPGARRACSRTAAQRRDFVHVRDVARANLLALDGGRPRPGAFNVARGTPRTVGEMARALRPRLRGARRAARVVTGEWRAGDVRHVFASPERAAGRLGFRARRRTSRPGWRSSPPPGAARAATRPPRVTARRSRPAPA